MENYCPALLLASAGVFVACPQATAAAINCGQTLTGRIVSPAQKDSCIFTADVGDKDVIPNYATSGSLRTDGDTHHPLVSSPLTLTVLGQMDSNSVYFTDIFILNPNAPGVTAKIDVYAPPTYVLPDKVTWRYPT